jgi:hypothetical protein
MSPFSDMPISLQKFGQQGENRRRIILWLPAVVRPRSSLLPAAAIAKRVTESIMNKTFLPLSRKYSAIAVAVNAALSPDQSRLIPKSDDNDGTGIPFRPKVFLHKIPQFSSSSPTSAMTLTSPGVAGHHSQKRAFANPDPAKIPIL